MEQSGIKLIVANFTEYPGPRYCNQGNSSGEEFYHEVLNAAFANAIESKQKLEVVLDGTAGYASSFLDEAFGNLVFDFSIKLVKENIIITSKQEPDWIKMIFEEVFNDWELRRKGGADPIKTKDHLEWFRYSDDKITKKEWL